MFHSSYFFIVKILQKNTSERNTFLIEKANALHSPYF